MQSVRRGVRETRGSVLRLQKIKKDGFAADFLFGRDWNMPMTHIGKRTRPFFGPMGKEIVRCGAIVQPRGEGI